MVSRIFNGAVAGMALAAASPLAAAQPTNAEAQFITGTKVVDPQGADVGTVVKIVGETLTVKTDKHEAAMPRSGFVATRDGLVVNMTREQLNAAVESSLAAAQAKLVPGAVVTGAQGTPVGSIDAIDDQFATLKLLSGKLIKIPRASLGVGPTGGMLGLSAKELEAMVAGSPS